MERNKINRLFLIILWVVVFLPVYPGLIEAWFKTTNADNSYGALVPFISLFFIWKKKDNLKHIKSCCCPKCLVLLVACLFIYILSYAGKIVFMQRLMLVSSLSSLVLYVYGKNVFNMIRFPLLFLFFMIPVPESVVGLISFPLQTYATIISTKIIHIFDIPVYREGHMLYFAQTQLEVAEACSGIHSISAMLMLSVIFVHQMEKTTFYRIIIVLSSVVIAFICNIMRVSGTGILAHFFGAGVASGFLHEFSGMAVFIVGLLMMFAEYKLLNSCFRG